MSRIRRGVGVDHGAIWDRPKMDSGVLTGIIVYVSGTALMILAGIAMVIIGPQG